MMARYLGEGFDLATFDFRTGKINHSSIRKSKRPNSGPYDFARGLSISVFNFDLHCIGEGTFIYKCLIIFCSRYM